MFLQKASVLLASFIVTILGTFESQETGIASDFELEVLNESTYTDIFISAQRYTTGSYVLSVNKPSAVIIPEMVWPTKDRKVSSGYGYRSSCDACSVFHEGTDFVPGYGEPVYAAMDGMVSRITHGGEYGVYVIIEHIAVINTTEQRWETLYAHLKEGSVPENIRAGSIVKAGSVIGAVGQTGLATGPHLHFEVRVEGEKVDPIKYLKMYGN